MEQGPLTFIYYSTVTAFARFLGLSISQPLDFAIWYENNCNGTTDSTGARIGLTLGMYITLSTTFL